MLGAWARFVHRHRVAVLAGAGAFVVAAVVLVAGGTDYTGNNTIQTEASRAGTLIDRELPSGPPTFVLVAGSDTLRVSDPGFRTALDAALVPLASDPRVVGVTTPFHAGPSPDPQMVSSDGHHALTSIAMSQGGRAVYAEIRSRVSSPVLTLVATGDAAVDQDYNRIINDDASRGERLSIPLSLVLLLLVFGSVVAACLPLAAAMFATLGGLAALAVITRVTDVDSAASNVVLFLGLGLGIDYSLFIVSRFREELRRGRTVEDALAVTYSTAGTAITVSGTTVAIGLAGLLFFTHTWLFGFALGVIALVAFAVLAALTVLPAVLSLLGPGVDRGRLWRPRRTEQGPDFWHRLATTVMRHPVAVLVPAVAVLLLPLVPFTQIRFGTDHLTTLPASAESRQGVELLRAQFPQTAQAQLMVVVHYPSGPVLTADHVGGAYDLARRLEALPGVLRVDSLVPPDRGLSRSDYQALYAQPVAALPPEARDAVHASVGSDILAMRVLTAAPERSTQARDLVAAVRGADAVPGADVLVGGQTAGDVDYVAFFDSRIPYALAFVLVATYVVLFLLFGSLLLPAKAVVMNLLSLTASFGALVFVFQQGHLSGLLGFTPAPIDPVLPMILFCLLFGLSMDYEVFLLTRIKEEYEAGGDTRTAVATGLERSGRLVTAAAAVMIGVVGCFGFGQTTIMKIIGLVMALAILVDATLVRGLVVPSVMELMGRANWWAPRPLLDARRRLLSPGSGQRRGRGS